MSYQEDFLHNVSVAAFDMAKTNGTGMKVFDLPTSLVASLSQTIGMQIFIPISTSLMKDHGTRGSKARSCYGWAQPTQAGTDVHLFPFCSASHPPSIPE